MSHDQRPGRYRVVGFGPGAAKPATPAQAGGSVQAPARARAARPAKPRRLVLPGIIFLSGCALGGCVTILVLFA